jgi:hypothetical protein
MGVKNKMNYIKIKYCDNCINTFKRNTENKLCRRCIGEKYLANK